MAKEKTFERNPDNITLKKLKYIIILCFVVCIMCEFAPDILCTCKWFNRCTFLQRHKEFMINISLGCLGSAVISYFMLQIQIRTIEKEKKEKLNILFKKVVSRYWKLICAITKARYIKNENEDLKKTLEEFINLYEEADLADKYFEDFVIIFKNKLIPIINEVEMFLDSFHLMVNKEEIIKLYNQKVYDKVIEQIHDRFYKSLNEKFQLQEINKKFVDINFANESLIEGLEKILETIHNSSDIRKYAIGNFEYSNMILKLISMENLEKLDNEVS